MNAEKNAHTTALGSTITTEVPFREEPHHSYTSDSYQKILDYHVGEILLTTIIFGVILLLRLHR